MRLAWRILSPGVSQQQEQLLLWVWERDRRRWLRGQGRSGRRSMLCSWKGFMWKWNMFFFCESWNQKNPLKVQLVVEAKLAAWQVEKHWSLNQTNLRQSTNKVEKITWKPDHVTSGYIKMMFLWKDSDGNLKNPLSSTGLAVASAASASARQKSLVEMRGDIFWIFLPDAPLHWGILLL